MDMDALISRVEKFTPDIFKITHFTGMEEWNIPIPGKTMPLRDNGKSIKDGQEYIPIRQNHAPRNMKVERSLKIVVLSNTF